MTRSTPATIDRSKQTLSAVAVAGALAVLAVFAASRAAASPSISAKKQGPGPTIGLVHGAWADASGWNGVIERLRKATRYWPPRTRSAVSAVTPPTRARTRSPVRSNRPSTRRRASRQHPKRQDIKEELWQSKQAR